jgi:hypothetical protein
MEKVFELRFLSSIGVGLVKVPDQGRIRIWYELASIDYRRADVATLRRIDAPQIGLAFSVFNILACADVDSSVIDQRRGD